MFLARFSLIVAIDAKNGISKDGRIPWHSPKDLKFFKDITMGHPVIMGRKTYESIPEKFKPLKGRKNIVISTSYKQKDQPDLLIAPSFEEALSSVKPTEEPFVIGGEGIYDQAIRKYLYLCNRIYVTKFMKDYNCDQFFPFDLISGFPVEKIDEDDEFVRYLFSPKVKHEEYQYLELLERVLQNGDMKEDRTQVGTLSIFGERMTFDIRDTIPLLTTKKVFCSGVIKELLFFLSGKTDTTILEKQGVKIWMGNTRKEFLEKRGLPYREGDMGPSYPLQWRHWGAEYTGCDTDYKDKGIDQIKSLVEGIRKDPLSRRHILTAWNVREIDKMALPPCHIMAQFNVSGNKKHLDCSVYLRSNDLFLGAPFNIASYAILTYMIAHVTGLKPRNLIYVMGDAHVYLNHREQVLQQLQRTPKPFPKLLFKDPEKLKEIDDFTYDSFILKDYSSWPTITAEMAI